MKLVVVINESLGMSSGKIASQACHAVTSLLRGVKPKKVEKLIDKWDSHEDGRKIVVVKAKDPSVMGWIAVTALKAGIHVGPVIVDEGRTEIPPHSITAQAYGPDEEDEFKDVTDTLALL